MGCRLLVADQNMLHLVLLEQGVIDVEDGTTRVAENDLNSFILQSADNHLRTR